MKTLLLALVILSLGSAWAQDFSDQTNVPPETSVEQQEGQEQQEPGAVNHNDPHWEGQESNEDIYGEEEYFEEDLQKQQQDIDPEFDPIDDELNPDENTY